MLFTSPPLALLFLRISINLSPNLHSTDHLLNILYNILINYAYFVFDFTHWNVVFLRAVMLVCAVQWLAQVPRRVITQSRYLIAIFWMNDLMNKLKMNWILFKNRVIISSISVGEKIIGANQRLYHRPFSHFTLSPRQRCEFIFSSLLYLLQ